MSNERYQRVKEVFFSACSAPVDERADVLARECGDDLLLRDEVEALLTVDDQQLRFLQQPLMNGERFQRATLESLREREPHDLLPTTIGNYRIVRLIGEGGMGSVYEAEQESPRRRVALKIIRPTLNSRSLMQRFDREVKILGRLQHPGIAQIFEAGIFDVEADGRVNGTSMLDRRRPYFAMEFVDGVPLTHYAVSHHLDLKSRLDLLVRVCEAIQYGHQRGVIHRDLKPANILVGADGVPKVIDFGVARATDADPMQTLHTDAGQLVGTLAYMCPEQVSGHPESVDVRSDVYALGVIGYELLGGRLPYDLTGKIAPEAARIICDSEPSSLSSISRIYRGDIETIIGKAIEKDARRRYQSAAELAADLQRYLNDEPITARPPTVRYQVGKFARRHKELVAGLALVVLALIAGIIGTSIAPAQATAARNAADRQALNAGRMSDVFQAWLRYARPGMAGGGRDVKVMEMLDAASADLHSQLIDVPEIELFARTKLGETYEGLGQFEKGASNFELALELAKATVGPDSAEALHATARGEFCRMRIRSSIGAQDERVRTLEKALATARVSLGRDHTVTQELLFDLGFAHSSRYEMKDAEPEFRELLQIVQRVPEAQRTVPPAAVMSRLAFVLMHRGNLKESESLRALAVEQQSDPAIAMLLLDQPPSFVLGHLYSRIGRLDEAERLLRNALALQTQALGEDHLSTIDVMSWLASLLTQEGRWEEALKYWKRECQFYDTHSPASWWGGVLHNYCATLLVQLKRPDEAKVECQKCIDTLHATSTTNMAAETAKFATVWFGIGPIQSWAGPGLRRSIRTLLNQQVANESSTSVELVLDDWDQADFSVTQWTGTTPMNQTLPLWSVHGVNEVRAMADPAPGIYLLEATIPRQDREPLKVKSWVLFADWNVKLTAGGWVLDDARTWINTSQPLPHYFPTLMLEDYFEEGFGPFASHLTFSIQGSATIDIPPGEYRIMVESDDGIRLWLNDQLTIDAYGEGVHHQGAQVNIGEGPQVLQVNYYQHGQAARLWVQLEPVPPGSPQ